MRRQLGLLAMLLILPASTVAQPATMPGAAAESPLAQANEAYLQGHYDSAIEQYENLMAQRGFSAPVLFDLGNAWLQAGQPGRAILNYERARWLAPGDAAIAANLQLARHRAGLPAAAASGWRTAFDGLRFNAFAWLGLAGLLALCAGVFLMRGRPRRPGWVWSTMAVGAVMLCATAAAMAMRWPDLSRAVILDAGTPARIAPAATAGVSFHFDGGQLVNLRRQYNSFLLVRSADGKSGWVSASQVVPIVASATGTPAPAAGSTP